MGGESIERELEYVSLRGQAIPACVDPQFAADYDDALEYTAEQRWGPSLGRDGDHGRR
jgi:hypothetical protein